MLQAKNGRVSLRGGDMDYIRFGSGGKTLVMIPGVGDGLKTVKGTALPFALMYRALAREYTVFVFSRRAVLPEKMTTREMAEDLNEAMEQLGLRSVALMGVSQGGMIAQWLALGHPDKVKSLVLTVTAARPNDTMREAISLWCGMARRGDYRALLLDTAERSYSPARLPSARLSCRLMGNLGKPKSFARFLTQARSCLGHDAFDRLGEIACPTLVIGGTEDKIVTADASRELAAAIPGAQLYLYEGLGHALYEEAPDFLRRVADFCG